MDNKKGKDKYTIKIDFTKVYRETFEGQKTIIIEAESKEEAIKAARDLANKNRFEWDAEEGHRHDYDDFLIGDVEIVDIVYFDKTKIPRCKFTIDMFNKDQQ